jgi:hypothetical protein
MCDQLLTLCCGLVFAAQEPSSIEKVAEIDEHIGCAMSGLTADAKTLIDHARADTQVRTAHSARHRRRLEWNCLLWANTCSAVQARCCTWLRTPTQLVVLPDAQSHLQLIEPAGQHVL